MIYKPLRRYDQLDSGALVRLFRQPDVYAPSADDHTDPSQLQGFIDGCLGNKLIYALGRNPKQEAFIFAPSHNATTYSAHFAVRKDCRDGSTVRKTAEAGKWMFEHTTCRAILTFIREDNAAARSALAQLGMRQKGAIEKSSLFGGQWLDEIVFYANVDDFNRLWADELGRVE